VLKGSNSQPANKHIRTQQKRDVSGSHHKMFFLEMHVMMGLLLSGVLLQGAVACPPAATLTLGINDLDLTQTLASSAFGCGGVGVSKPMVSALFTASTAGTYTFGTWFGGPDRDTVINIRDGNSYCGGTSLGCADDSGSSNAGSLSIVMTASQTVTVNIARYNGTPFGSVTGSVLVAKDTSATCVPNATLTLGHPYMVPSTLADMKFFGLPNTDCLGFPIAQILTFTAPVDSWYMFYTNVTATGDRAILELHDGGCDKTFLKCDLGSGVGYGLSDSSAVINITLNASQTVYVLMGAWGSLQSNFIPINVVSADTLAPTPAPTGAPKTSSPTSGAVRPATGKFNSIMALVLCVLAAIGL
jgi:hypothetical protein